MTKRTYIDVTTGELVDGIVNAIKATMFNLKRYKHVSFWKIYRV